MVGTALTMRTCMGDNLAIHQALELLRPGDVIVVDGGGDVSRALIGEIMMTIAQSRGAAGYVIDGAIRDAAMIAQSDFPCFARAAIHRGPYKNGPGEINVPVNVGGLVVMPGDIVVGDADGVVAFPQNEAGALLQAVRAQEEREAEILLSIREGRYAGATRATPRGLLGKRGWITDHSKSVRSKRAMANSLFGSFTTVRRIGPVT
jgi:RraA family protein